MKALETTEGLGARGKSKKEDRRLSSQTFTAFKSKCDICQGNRTIKSCEKFKAMGVDDRWQVAKDKRLCLRCLANNHQGKDCKRAKECGVNGCKRNHDRFLHKSEGGEVRERTVGVEESPNHLAPTRTFTSGSNRDTPLLNSVEQGSEEYAHITTLASTQHQDVVSLRTVPVWICANGKKIKVNALLDDTSSVSYVNEIVFDASAKFQGTSLNYQILPGPKLQTNLFEVLLSFRRFPIAIACDVSEMYLQIRIPPPDCPMFRFLWRNLEVDRSPDVYEFERVVFGYASALFRAQFVSLENAKVHEKEFPLCAETVSKSSYMA